MIIRAALVALLLIVGHAAFAAPPQPVREVAKFAGESDAAFASRVLKVPQDEVHTLAAPWDGVPTVFADYVTGRDTDHPERPLVALQQGARGTYRKVLVTVGETEGGEPDIEAIAFANADHDAAKELIVILAWNATHSGGCTPLYEVRIFDEPKPGEAALRLLPLSKHFDGGCAEHYRFKSIAAVKRELSRLGY